MEEYLSPGQLIQIAGMFGDAVYNEIVEEHRHRMIGLAEHLGWPDEIIPMIRNIEGYNVGVLEQRLEESSRNDDWDMLVGEAARYLDTRPKP